MRLILDNLSRTVRTPVWCILVIFVIVMEVRSLTGPNVCIVKQKYNITKRVKYRAPMSVRTYEWCFAMPPRCSRWNTEMRDLTRLETEERTAEMAVCCPGYKMKDISCVPICPNGKTGPSCKDECPPNKWGPNCVHECAKCKYGTCSPDTGECLCQDGWQGESCDRMISTTTSEPMMEQILTSAKTTASTKPPFLSTTTLGTSTSTTKNTNVATSTLLTIPILTTKSTPRISIFSTTDRIENPVTTIATTVSTPVKIYKNMTLADTSSVLQKTVNEDKMQINLAENTPTNKTHVNETALTTTARDTLFSEPPLKKVTSELTTKQEASTARTTILYTVMPKTSPSTENMLTNKINNTTVKTETTRKPEVIVRQQTTLKFKPKEIWIRPAQKGESPFLESKVKANHDTPLSRSKTREISTAATTPKTIVVSIIPTSVTYTSFKRIALTTPIQSLRNNVNTKQNNNTQFSNQSYTNPMAVRTNAPTFITTKIPSRKVTSSTSINQLLHQSETQAESYPSFSTKEEIKTTTLSAAQTTNSMSRTSNVSSKTLNSSLLTTVFTPLTNAITTTGKPSNTPEIPTRSPHTTTTIKAFLRTEPTVSATSTTKRPPVSKSNVTIGQQNVTMTQVTTTSKAPPVTKTFVDKQMDTNVSKQNLTTNAKTNTVTEDPTKDEETFHILTEPEHITAVMSDKERDRSTVDLISVISIAGGVMMAIITVAVIIVMVERCKKPRYEDVRKYNNIRMQVMIDNNDVAPPPYVRSIFHTPLPEPPTSEKCHYQPISTLDRNLRQFMRPVVVQTISPLMLDNFRDILECHYDHLPRRSHDIMETMQGRCSMAPSVSEREQLLQHRVHSLTDSDIEAMKCEAKQDVIDNTTSEPLYAEIPCWRPPSEHAIEVVNLNGEAVTEL